MKSNLFYTLIFILLSKINFGQISNDLILEMNFSNNFIDQSISNLNYSNSGVTFTNDPDGNINQAGYFSGNNFLSVNSNLLKNDLPFSMSFWIKREVNSVGGVVFCSDNEFNNYYGYWVAIGPSGEIGTHIAGGLGSASSSNRRGFITTSFLQVGVWQHVVVIYRSYNDIDVYFDCIEQPGFYTGSGSTTMVYSNTESRIGGQIGNTGNASGVFYKGDLDELKIWKREITLQEIGIICQGSMGFDISANIIHNTCDSNNLSGEISIFPNPPGFYSYDWAHDNNLNTSSADSLPPGIYNVSISNGFFEIDTSFEVFGFEGITSVNFLSEDSYCSQGGSITIDNINGGASPFLTSINNNGFQPTFVYDDLIPGQYQISILDNNNCQIDTLIEINNINFEIDVNLEIEPNCLTKLHNLQVEVIGGSNQGFTFTLNNNISNSTGIFNDLVSGIYSISITDIYSCAFDTIIEIIPFYNIESIEFELNNETCNSLNGTFEIVNDGNSQLVDYYLVDTDSINVGELYSNLDEGFYNLSIFDLYGCSYDTVFFISNDNSLFVEFDTNITVDCSQQNVNIEIDIFNDGGYVYSIDNISNTNGIFNNLSSGVYYLIIQDSLGCFLDTSFTISEFFDKESIILTINNSICNSENGSFYINETSSNSGNPIFTFDNTIIIENQLIEFLSSGLYAINIKDEFGCEYDTIFSIENVDIDSFTFDYNFVVDSCSSKVITLIDNINGGIEPYSFAYNNLDFTTNSNYTFYENDFLNIKIKDSNNCIFDYSLDVPNIKFENLVKIPNCFTPDNDGINDNWFVEIECFESYHCQIFNRWGQLVFQSFNVEDEWNGKHNELECSEGVYFYKIYINIGESEKVEYSGNITVLRSVK